MTLYLGFPVSAQLRAKVVEAIDRVRQQAPAQQHADLVTAAIIAMTDTGIAFYFSQMVGRMQLGKGADRVVAVALKTVTSGLHLIIRRVGKSLSNEQFYPLVDFLEQILLQRAEQWYVVFPATPELERRLYDYIEQVHQQPPATDHAWQCHDLIITFKQTALDFFFRQSTDRLGVQGWAAKAVDIGITMADGASNKPLQRVVPTLSEEALLSLADFYRSVMIEQAAAPRR